MPASFSNSTAPCHRQADNVRVGAFNPRDEAGRPAPGSCTRPPCPSARRSPHTRRVRHRRAGEPDGRSFDAATPPGHGDEATPVSTSCARPASSRSIRAASAASTRFAENFPLDDYDGVGANDGALGIVPRRASALLRARRSTYAAGASPSCRVSSTLTGSTANSNPAAESSSRRRGELEASTSRMTSMVILLRTANFELRNPAILRQVLSLKF